ncbi:MAG: P1 family peptidase [Gracilimonas sp.]|uniref:DmpA family aminopeptidase n=1 Tax=Gracilimonas TaxID=649462 RepID=UPI001B1446E9|nr:P1 family peptidase [Gracilimonas sp.]MBO6585649.1 P1 family peptidase [Gracilimonas sp.]MBO6616646.1 P1 family peptidase [Gracilimonas sp.]
MRSIPYILFILLFTFNSGFSQDRQRPRDLGIKPGILTPGPLNAITDVEGVQVGHKTIIEGENIRTGVTMILPHDGGLFKSRVPAAVYVGNGFGKALGFTQIRELGEIETPIGLTNTLSIHTVANGITDYILRQPGNENVRSVNPVVGETNDGWLNDIRGRHVTMQDVFEAIKNARSGSVEEGSVGAGTGTSALGFKGGIGTSSRQLPAKVGGYTVGVLVQSNFGGVLTIDGAPVGEELENHYLSSEVPYDVDGSVMIIVATDAPLLSRNLERLAKRAFLGISRVGGFASNGSGDYVIAFSTHEDVRIEGATSGSTQTYTELKNSATTPLFLAAVEATEEAILNSLFMATTVTGDLGHTQQALPIPEVLEIMEKYNLLEP